MNENISRGIIAVLAIMAGFGGSLTLDQDSLDHAYICTINENVGVFDRLSSTNKTGYYFDEKGVEQSKVCRNGEWINLIDYAKMRGVDPLILLNKQDSTSNLALKEICFNDDASKDQKAHCEVIQ